jgi:hypothetical protein
VADWYGQPEEIENENKGAVGRLKWFKVLNMEIILKIVITGRLFELNPAGLGGSAQLP